MKNRVGVLDKNIGKMFAVIISIILLTAINIPKVDAVTNGVVDPSFEFESVVGWSDAHIDDTKSYTGNQSIWLYSNNVYQNFSTPIDTNDIIEVSFYRMSDTGGTSTYACELTYNDTTTDDVWVNFDADGNWAKIDITNIVTADKFISKIKLSGGSNNPCWYDDVEVSYSDNVPPLDDFFDGFESNDFSNWDEVSVGTMIGNTTVHTDDYAYESYYNGTNYPSIKNNVEYNEIYTNAWYRFNDTAIPDGGMIELLAVGDSLYVNIEHGGYGDENYIAVYGTGNTFYYNITVLSDVWYELKVHYYADGIDDASFQIYWDDVRIIDDSLVGVNFLPQYIYYSGVADYSGVNTVSYIDDIWYSGTEFNPSGVTTTTTSLTTSSTVTTTSSTITTTSSTVMTIVTIQTVNGTLCGAVRDGSYVFIGSSSGYIYSYYGSSGVLAWSIDVGYPVTKISEVYGGYIYAITDYLNVGRIHKINSSNGAIEWVYTVVDVNQYQPYQTITTIPVVDVDNNVYFGSSNGYLYSLSTNGAFIWKYHDNIYYPVSGGICVTDSKIVYVQDDASFVKVVCLNSVDGTFIWRYSISNGNHMEYGTPDLSDDNSLVYIGQRDFKLNALNMTDGTSVWQYDMVDDCIVYSDSMKIVQEDGRLYFNGGIHFYCLNATTSSLIWGGGNSTGWFSSPYLNNGDFVYLTNLYDVYSVLKDSGNGGVGTWSCSIPDNYSINRPVSDDLTYIVTVAPDDNRVYFFGIGGNNNPVPSLNYISINGVYMNETDNFNFWLFRADVYEMIASTSNTDYIEITIPDTMHTMKFIYDKDTNNGKVTVTGFSDPNQNMNVIGLATTSWVTGSGVNETLYKWTFVPNNNIIDCYNQTISYQISNDWFDIYGSCLRKVSIYNLGGKVTYETIGDGHHIVGGDVFEIGATNGTSGSSIKASAIYRRLQQIHLLGEWYFAPDVINSEELDEIASGGELEYRFDYAIDGVWIEGWKCIITPVDSNVGNFGIGADASWVKFAVGWYNQGVLIKTEYIISYDFAFDVASGTFPTARPTTTFWVDLWFNKMNSSSVVGGRVNSEYHGMYEQTGWWFSSDFRPLFTNVTSSMFFTNLKDENGDNMSCFNINLVKVSTTLRKLDRDVTNGNLWKTMPYQILELKVAGDRMEGINTPVFVETRTLDIPSTGFFAPIVSTIGGIATAIFVSALGFMRVLIGSVDTFLAIFGVPSGTFSSLIGMVVGTLATVMSWFTIAVTQLQNMLMLFGALITNMTTLVNYAVNVLLWTFTNVFTMPLQVIALLLAVINGTSITFYGILLDFTSYASLMAGAKQILPLTIGIALLSYIIYGNMSLDGDEDMANAPKRVIGLFMGLKDTFDGIFWMYNRIRAIIINMISAIKAWIPSMSGGMPSGENTV
jgi:outer membrane protein assembly factor BamB